MGEVVSRRVHINVSFLSQPLTGQQRYASEILSCLRAQISINKRTELKLHRYPLRHNRYAQWLAATIAPLFRRSSSVTLSLTSRAPVWAPNHVLVVHDIFPITNPEWFTGFYAWTHKEILKLQLKFAKVVVCVSAPVAAQVSTSTKAKIVVAPNASVLGNIPPGQDKELTSNLSKLGIQQKQFFLCIGSADPRKNLTILLEAFSRYHVKNPDGWKLVVIGDTSSSKIFRKVDFPVSSGVAFLGRVTDQQLRQLYEVAGGLVFPSLAEGFGLPLVEAMSAGLPILANDNEVHRWVCQDYAMWANCQDVQDLSEKLAKLTKAAARNPQEPFSWKKSAEAIASAIGDL